MEITHGSFTLERTYESPVSAVFAAWASEQARRRWFARDVDYGQDFTVGGAEWVRARRDDEPDLVFESRYHDIVENTRIMYTSTLSSGDDLSTVSATTVEFEDLGASTRLVVTEHGMYLPGMEQPDWRERGTSDQLDALATELAVTS